MEEVKKNDKYRLVQVPTQHQLAVETVNGETVTLEGLMVEIANRLLVVEKALTLLLPDKIK